MPHLSLPGLRIDRAPQPAQEVQIVNQRCFVDPFRCGTRDDAAAFLQHLRCDLQHQPIEEVVQARTFRFILDPCGNADVPLMRQQHQIARRHRQQRGQPRTLAAQRILQHLHQHFPALAEQTPHCRHRYGAVDGMDHVGDVQESGTLQADIDERRLHARQYPLHRTLVDIADQAVTRCALDVDFLRCAAFDQRHAGLLLTDIDENFGTHYGRRTPKRFNSCTVSYSGRPTTPV